MIKMNWLTLSSHAILGFIASWVYLVFTTPYAIHVLGKANGIAVNYGISWILMLGIVYILQKLKRENTKE